MYHLECMSEINDNLVLEVLIYPIPTGCVWGGDILYPPHYCLPTLIWKPNGLSNLLWFDEFERSWGEIRWHEILFALIFYKMY